MTGIVDAVAIVTGGASGIGLGIAGQLRRAGARVVIADLHRDAAEHAATALGAVAIAVDVSHAASVDGLVEQVKDRFGTVDIMVNNAGVGPAAEIAEMTLDDWRWLLGINLFGVIHGVHAVLPTLVAQGSGHIVNISSMSALAPMPPLGGYAVSKAAITALTEVLSRELEGSGVRTTVVFPGPTRTNITESLRHRMDGGGALRDFRISPPDELWRTPEEVGDTVVAAITADEELVITHPELIGRVNDRQERIAAAFRDATARLVGR